MPLYEIWDQNMKGGDCGDWFVPFLLPSDVDEEALSEREEAGRGGPINNEKKEVRPSLAKKDRHPVCGYS